MISKRNDVIFIKITEACNLGCSYCIYKHNNDDTYLELDEIDNIMKYHIDKGYNSVYRVDIIGGEPTYNPKKLYKIIEYLSDNYNRYIKYLNIITNGINLNDDMIKILKTYDKVVLSISYDGFNIYNRYPKNISDNIRNKILKYCDDIPITVYTVIGISQEYNPLIDIYNMFNGKVRQRIFEDHKSYTLKYDEYVKYIDKIVSMWKDYIMFLNKKINIKKISLNELGKYIHLFYRGIENDGSFDICTYKLFSEYDKQYSRCARYNYINDSGIQNPCERCTEYGRYFTERKRDIEKEVLNFEY